MRMVRFPIYLFCVLVAVFILESCDNYDDFTTDTNSNLRFSKEELFFDTLFSTVPSVTKTLIVWNDANKGIRIQSVRLDKGDESLYRVNVDGEFLHGELSNLDIHGGDSLFVFAEITVGNVMENDTIEYNDQLVFTLENGCEQRVNLKTIVMYGELFRETLSVDDDIVMEPTHARVFYNSLVVEQGSTLTLKAGTKLYFHTNSSLIVHGTLNVEGAASDMVVLRGDRLDNLFDNLPYDNTVGRWGGLILSSASQGNILNHLDIHSGTFGLDANGASFVMDGCIVHNVDGDALKLVRCNSKISNSQFSNAHGHCVSIYGGCNEFSFCTIAQFYPWQGDRKAALLLADTYKEDEAILLKADFNGCLITGYGDDELTGSLENSDNVLYRFNQCQLRKPKLEDEDHYCGVVWELAKNDSKQLQCAKQFVLVDTTDFIYDFTPLPIVSIGIGAVDDELGAKFPFDLRGNPRTSPYTVGCYEPLHKEIY